MKMTIELENATAEFRVGIEKLSGKLRQHSRSLGAILRRRKAPTASAS